MSENKTKWWAIIAVVIIVAVLASLITVNLTGNVIKVSPERKGTDIYTRAEVDSKLSAFETSIQNHLAGKYSNYTLAKVLEMLDSKCSIERVNDNLFKNQNFSSSCDQKCAQVSKTFVASYLLNFGGSENDGTFKAVTSPLKCSEIVSQRTFGQLGGYSSIELMCNCCSI
jgi:hypothetical protein